VKIAGLQLDIAWEDPEENFRRAERLASRAVAGGAQMLVLPEAFATGFSMRSTAMAGHADTVRRFLVDLAKENGIWVLGGLIEPGKTRPVNACSLVGPDGKEVLHCRKIHPFTLAGEHEHFETGSTVRTGMIDGVRITPLICYDLRFIELFRAVASHTDLFVVIANWPAARAHAWRTLLAARAIDCQAYVLGVNRVGDAEGHPHCGDTTLVDPMGKVIETLAHEPGVVLGDVDPEKVADVRRRYPFLADRRPEVYRDH
jgi:predicted amidohydrolase